MEGEEREDMVESLCRHTARLLGRVPGPVQRVSVRIGDTSLEIEWPANGGPGPAGTGGGASAAGDAVEDEAPPGLDYLRAPMVGTFYRAPAPDARPFVTEGDVVEVGRQVAIIEAMKLMNPVEAVSGGRILEVLVEDGTPVEYDQPLFAVASAEHAEYAEYAD